MTIIEKNGKKIKVCLECKNKGGKKCDDCKTRKATFFTVMNPNNPNDKPALCEECNQKRIQKNKEPIGNQEKGEKIKIIFEKVLERCPEEGFKPFGEHNGKKQWCVYTPIWIKRITKEEARELKELCQGANPKSDFRYTYWVNWEGNYKYDFEKTLPNFIQELDKIISGKDTKDKNQEHNEYTCEKCQTSCWKDRGDKGSGYYRKRIRHWYTDFRMTTNYFCIDGDYGNSVKKGNSKCAEEFKKEHFQTCPQCGKNEWPDMDKGWMLDYEINKAFCSSKCHVEYRQLSWEQAQNLTQIQMYPPQLDISNSGNQPNFDWEKEGLKREVLFWREYARELEKKLVNKNNLTPEEKQQANYLKKLQQNTLQNAENSYSSKYGKLTENNPSNSNQDKGTNYTPWIIGGGIILVVGIVAYFWMKNRKGKTRH